MTKKKNGLAVVAGFLSKHRNIALVSVAVLLVSTSIVGAQDFGGGAQTVVNCSAAGSCENAITNGGSETFGANQYEETDLISLHLTDDLTVDGTITTADATITGEVTGEYLPHVSQATIVNVTTTQELCDITNSGSVPRMLSEVGAVYGTNVSGAATRLTVSSNFEGGAVTGTAGTNLIGDMSWTLSVASSTGSTSSTAGFLMTSAEKIRTWDPGEHLVYLTEASTSTLSGTCYAIWSSY
ncbi:MAG: hypothetical protein WC763_05185 [Candidatus Paceibacterota bacterium]|jgi:hypothetical protein